MPRRLLFALLTLVAAPLVLLGWLSASTMQDQRQEAEFRLQGLLRSRLVEIDRSLGSVVERYARELSAELSEPGKIVDNLLRVQCEDPIVRQGILVSSDGIIVYPPRPVADDPENIALYASLAGMIDARPILDARKDSAQVGSGKLDSPSTLGMSVKGIAVPQQKIAESRVSKNMQSIAPRKPTGKKGSAIKAFGPPQWQVWYMDEGSQLILWVTRDDGSDVGFLLERARWVSDLTAVLPDTVSRAQSNSTYGDATPGFTALVDEAKQIVYRWGDEGDRQRVPLSMVSLSSPLSSWQLEYHADKALLPASDSTPLFLSLAGIGVVLLALGGYVLTSVQRQMRAARNRVSFAGQVSHELRTPLTNIRLYAELAESDIQQLTDDQARQKIASRLGVIDTECRRLGRLVSSVLEMIREDGRKRQPRLAPACPDQVIDQAIAQFAPSFRNADLVVNRDAGAEKTVAIDADILEMVIVNLLSNVEKYAADGKQVDVRSRLSSSELIVSITDHGAGIAHRHHRSIFRPFSRLDDSINAPSGTGIGLTIARRAARRHGGELQLVSSTPSSGACFELRLPISTAASTNETDTSRPAQSGAPTDDSRNP